MSLHFFRRSRKNSINSGSMRSLLATIFVLGLSPSSLAAGEKIEAIVGEWIGTGGYEESFSVDSTGQGCYREPESTECVELSFTFLGDNQYGIAEVENIVLELNGNSITGYRDGEIFGTYQRVSSVNTESEFQALFRKAEEGDPDAQFILGEWYETGDRVELNIDAALHWYRLAAEQGHAGAQFKLSIAYRDGLQVERVPLWEE